MIRIMPYDRMDRRIFDRSHALEDVSDDVRAIIADVRAGGDEALLDYCRRFDGVRPDPLVVTEEEIDAAVAATDPEFFRIMERAADHIRLFHSRQIHNGYMISEGPGIVLGAKVTPIFRVGIYIPGGTAAYPSTVLMNALPAKIAGVSEICMATPAKGGRINPHVLAAARIAGVTRIYKMGGAQAIAALAYGTESVPAVDKITGPGNAYVAEAKKQVYGKVAIDMVAGPSEILVIADDGGDSAVVAADMLSQAEHDRNASAVLITDSPLLARAVAEELERQLPGLEREDIARASIEHNGKIIIADSIDQAIDISNALAPEHLELYISDPFDCLDKVRNAGSVFLGRSCPEALGDYYAGPNHTLPTGGAARFASPLSVHDFVKTTQYIYYTAPALEHVGPEVARFAREEGLGAHAASVDIRLEGGKDGKIH